jgi:hypothetical protein
LVVSAYLLDLGFPVFRSLSPSAPFDIVVLHDGVLLGVEVRTGWRNAVTKTISCVKDHDGADCLAIRLRGEIDPVFTGVTDAGKSFIEALSQRQSLWSSALPA